MSMKMCERLSPCAREALPSRVVPRDGTADPTIALQSMDGLGGSAIRGNGEWHGLGGKLDLTRLRTHRPVSRLIGRVWKLPDVGRVTAVTPTAALLAQADGSWPGLRLRTDRHHHWRWTNLMEGMEERFGLVDAAGHPAALWCGLRRRLLRLPTGAAYRLDYFQIYPKQPGRSRGLSRGPVSETRAPG